jgi:hypothetical protein
LIVAYSGHLRDALKELNQNVAEQFASKGVTPDWKAEGIVAPQTLGGLPVLLHNLDEILSGCSDPWKSLARDIVEQEVQRFFDVRYGGRMEPWDLMKT